MPDTNPDSRPDSHVGEDPDDADPRLAPLLAWRQQLIDSGAVAARSFKEAHLRLVLRSGRTDAEQIRAMLPGSVAEHADEMARVLSELAISATEQIAVTGRHRVSNPPPAAPDVAAPSLPPPAAVPVEPAPPAEPAAAEKPLAATDFAPFTFAAQRPPMHSVALRRDRAGLTLSWPPYQAPGGVVIYRAVSSEDNPPYAPDRAHLVGATTETAVTDDRAPAAAVRHYQVWINVGASREEALAAQPLLHAAGVLVSPIVDFVIREDAGRVIGQWSVPPGVSAVYVYRVPVAEAGRDGPQYRILAGHDNLTGFVDADTKRGERYVYRARCAATVDGVLRLSEAVETDVEVSAVLAPVADLAVATGIDGDAFDLTWTPPAAGRVVIYRSENGPSAGSDAGELPEDALEQVGLGPELRLTQPVVNQTGPDGRVRALMAGVSWPAGWSRAYLTPVTILSGRALLGRTLSSVRTGTIRDIELAEYCNKQVLTFDWPDGAAGVVMYLAPKGYDPRNGLTGKSFEISLEEYEKYGGMQLTGQLPVGGCSLHLAPVAFSGGRRVTGAVVSVEYHGLLRLQYAVRIGRDPHGYPATATIAMRSEHDLPGSPAFVLVNNPQRIPLSVHDGQAVDVAPLDAQGQLSDRPSKELRWSQLTTTGTGELWAANVRGLQGWIRLFVNTPSAERLRVIALLDPPVDSLRLTVPAQ
ncbi:hypothetical protein [Mycolicibacterium mageritense]|uniref:hypothetical protein n=1 Tax=Mycolicibacterium mageritense TaxID=53462 RepID=UPI0011D867E8|nr:hypothetical protein [Mycolicibacterium mageritense]TXI60516.1 MAG: hypothetical protein E6Q55_19285 [Mycolicibacterium mageritense]GJJ19649.1 putative ESX-1 scaffolding and assembly protein SaeA [Mycolicibacterium mageritense]